MCRFCCDEAAAAWLWPWRTECLYGERPAWMSCEVLDWWLLLLLLLWLMPWPWVWVNP